MSDKNYVQYGLDLPDGQYIEIRLDYSLIKALVAAVE